MCASFGSPSVRAARTAGTSSGDRLLAASTGAIPVRRGCVLPACTLRRAPSRVRRSTVSPTGLAVDLFSDDVGVARVPRRFGYDGEDRRTKRVRIANVRNDVVAG